MLGNTIPKKNPVTMTMTTAAIERMIATSRAKIETRTPWRGTDSVTGAADERVTHAAHGADHCRLAWIIAELFYKFHSFTLECAAFLATWFVIDALVQKIVRPLFTR